MSRHRSLVAFVRLALLAASAAGPGLAAAAPDPLPAAQVIDLGEGIKMEFVLIKAGTFSMGTNTHEYDEAPVHQVTLTRPFYLGKFEVTQAQWQRVMGSNPSQFVGADHPVENVSWEDCEEFLAKLQERTGRPVVLPTEAQWEYACRAGSTTEYGHGDDEERLGEYAWYSANSDLKTHPVGRRKPNAWGLHDMHGNVYEWCADWYSEGPYAAEDAVDPTGPATGKRRTLRGGAWIYVPDNLRSSDRGFSPPSLRTPEYGLRCVLEAGDAPATPRRPANVTRAPVDPAAALVARLDHALAERDRLQAEFLAGELAKLDPKAPRVADTAAKVGAWPVPAEQLTVELPGGVKMEFILIRPGTFTMGSDGKEVTPAHPAHPVAISRPYYIGRYEVTQRQWNALMDQNRSAFGVGDPRAADLPIDNINWHLCKAFLARLNDRVPGHAFRLPTEAEWEYACRAGSSGDLAVPASELGDYAWYGENAARQTHPVGGKKPNAWGLYDMYGNVWEWCHDWFAPYPAELVFDPAGPPTSGQGNARVLRGGAWNNLAKHVNSTFRHDTGADILMAYYGFRCVASANPRREEIAP